MRRSENARGRGQLGQGTTAPGASGLRPSAGVAAVAGSGGRWQLATGEAGRRWRGLRVRGLRSVAPLPVATTRRANSRGAVVGVGATGDAEEEQSLVSFFLQRGIPIVGLCLGYGMTYPDSSLAPSMVVTASQPLFSPASTSPTHIFECSAQTNYKISVASKMISKTIIKST
jgi:hypothetical protein